MPDEQNPELTFDERLKFLHQSTESLHDSCQELHAAVQEQSKQMGQLRELSDRNEKRWAKLNNAIYAAALEYFKPEDGAEPTGQS